MAESRKLPVGDYQAYIVDVDGTLYFKRPMQIRMALRLMGHYLLRLFKLKELFLLRDYRKMRDMEELADKEDIEQILVRTLSEKYRFTDVRTKQVIDDWILVHPLRVLYACRDKRLIRFLEDAARNGKKIYIYSDYPAENKCAALGICADGIYWPDGERISVLKPSAQGLNFIIDSNHLDRPQILFIGDRLEKDGACAKAAGIDHLILKKQRLARAGQYQRIFVGK